MKIEACAALISGLCATNIWVSGELIAYIIIAFAMIFEGEIFLLVAGSLVHLDVLAFWPTLIASFLGTVASDIFWYSFGKKYGTKLLTKHGRWFFVTPERFIKIEQLIQKKGNWLIFLSKFLYGLNHAFLTTAGAVKFDFKRFVKIQIFASAFWVVLFVLLGKVFASSLSLVKKDVRLVGLGMLALVILIVLLEKFLKKRFLRKFLGNGN